MPLDLLASLVPILSDGKSAARRPGNDHYAGMAPGWVFLALMGCMNMFRRATHLLTADGGAERIAGIDLSQNGEVNLEKQ